MSHADHLPANALSIPIVWALYPESNQRTLEEMVSLNRITADPQDLLFAADVPWNWAAEANYKKLKAEHPEIVHNAKRGENVAVENDGRASSV